MPYGSRVVGLLGGLGHRKLFFNDSHFAGKVTVRRTG